MLWTENERDWIAKAASASPRLRESVRKAISSDKFAISPIYRRFVVNELLTDDERAEICKMVWSRFKINVSGRDVIFTALLRAKLPEQLYRDFQQYMHRVGIELSRKRIHGTRVYATLKKDTAGRRFKWWCALNSKLASEHNVQFCNIKFTRCYCLIVDAYAQQLVDLDYVRKAFSHLVNRDYTSITWMVRDIGWEKRGTILSAWVFDGKVVRVARALYKVHCESFKAALRNNEDVSLSPQSA